MRASDQLFSIDFRVLHAALMDIRGKTTEQTEEESPDGDSARVGGSPIDTAEVPRSAREGKDEGQHELENANSEIHAGRRNPSKNAADVLKAVPCRQVNGA